MHVRSYRGTSLEYCFNRTHFLANDSIEQGSLNGLLPFLTWRSHGISCLQVREDDARADRYEEGTDLQRCQPASRLGMLVPRGISVVRSNIRGAGSFMVGTHSWQRRQQHTMGYTPGPLR